jgi:hypothetical protein
MRWGQHDNLGLIAYRVPHDEGTSNVWWPAITPLR